MLKDITLSHFWILMRMGYNMQTIYDANYGEETENLYLDYKDYVPHSKKQGKMLFDYTRYQISIGERKECRVLTVRAGDEFDYDKYFSNNNLGTI